MSRIFTLLSCGALAVFASGCTGLVVYEGTGPISISGDTAPPRPKALKKSKAILGAMKIEITEKVQFEKDQAVIKAESFELLNDVADVMKEHPEIRKVAIEGHASSDGDDNHNLQLSDARAKAVMAYLATHGVEAERMTAQGYGEKKPIGDNNTEEGREKNRRVEFNVVDRGTPKK